MLGRSSIKYIQIGFITRLLLMAIILSLPIDYRLKTILVFSTDFIDCWTLKLVAYFNKDVKDAWKLCKSYRYQSIDKAIDLFTYFILYVYLGLSPIYLYIIIIRLIGITMFYKTLNSHWLIIFPDVFKEMLLYDWFISKLNVANFNIIFVSKIIFEYIWHNYMNNNNYKKDD
jgi:hypothetical protein